MPVTPQEASKGSKTSLSVIAVKYFPQIDKTLTDNYDMTGDSDGFVFDFPTSDGEGVAEYIADVYRDKGWVVKVDYGSQYNEPYINMIFKRKRTK